MRKLTAFLFVIAAVAITIALLRAQGVWQRGAQTMSQPNFVFVGFPHTGRFVELDHALDGKQDSNAATKYYRDMLIGKDRKYVEELCRAERDLLAKGVHEADGIGCREDGPSVFRIWYTYAVKDEGTIIPVGWDWVIKLTFREGLVDEVKATGNLLTP